MTDGIELFRQYLYERKRISTGTRTCYLSDVRAFAKWHQSEYGAENFVLTYSQLEQYRQNLMNSGCSAAKTNRAMSAIRCYCSALERYGLLPNRPQNELHNLPLTRRAAVQPAEHEVRRLLAEPDEATPKGCRDKVLLQLLSTTDLKVGEVLKLNLKDVTLQAQVLRCVGRPEPVALSKATVRVLERYVSEFRTALAGSADNPALFLNQSGTRLSRQGLWKILRAYVDQAELSHPVTLQELHAYPGSVKKEMPLEASQNE